MKQEKVNYVTEEGLQKLKDELDLLKGTKRREVAERLKIAIGYGDLSENSEYDAAKNEQAHIEARIVTVENLIVHSKIINQEEIGEGVVHIGSTVVIAEVPDGEHETYTIVGTTETDPHLGKISNESPIGSQLLGNKEGDTVKVEVPTGAIMFKIIEIK